MTDAYTEMTRDEMRRRLMGPNGGLLVLAFEGTPGVVEEMLTHVRRYDALWRESEELDREFAAAMRTAFHVETGRASVRLEQVNAA